MLHGRVVLMTVRTIIGNYNLECLVVSKTITSTVLTERIHTFCQRDLAFLLRVFESTAALRQSLQRGLRAERRVIACTVPDIPTLLSHVSPKSF